jgi:hypothetical protein
MPTILDEIVAHKRRELAQAKAATPESDLEARCERLPPGRGFAARLVTPGPGGGDRGSEASLPLGGCTSRGL